MIVNDAFSILQRKETDKSMRFGPESFKISEFGLFRIVIVVLLLNDEKLWFQNLQRFKNF